MGGILEGRLPTWAGGRCRKEAAFCISPSFHRQQQQQQRRRREEAGAAAAGCVCAGDLLRQTCDCVFVSLCLAYFGGLIDMYYHSSHTPRVIGRRGLSSCLSQHETIIHCISTQYLTDVVCCRADGPLQIDRALYCVAGGSHVVHHTGGGKVNWYGRGGLVGPDKPVDWKHLTTTACVWMKQKKGPLCWGLITS